DEMNAGRLIAAVRAVVSAGEELQAADDDVVDRVSNVPRGADPLIEAAVDDRTIALAVRADEDRFIRTSPGDGEIPEPRFETIAALEQKMIRLAVAQEGLAVRQRLHGMLGREAVVAIVAEQAADVDRPRVFAGRDDRPATMGRDGKQAT